MKKNLAQALSVLFHPLLVPTYLVALLCFGLPQLPLGLAADGRWTVVAAVWLLTFVGPALAVLLLVRLGRAASVELARREQRPVPMLVAAAGFAAAAAAVHFHPPFYDLLLLRLLVGILAAVVVALLITLWWKISAHAVGMGGAVGLLFLLTLRDISGAPAWLAFTVLAAAGVGAARLVLRAHTPAQVAAGFVLGASLALAGLVLL